MLFTVVCVLNVNGTKQQKYEEEKNTNTLRLCVCATNSILIILYVKEIATGIALAIMDGHINLRVYMCVCVPIRI